MYRRRDDGSWSVDAENRRPRMPAQSIELKVEQSPDDPPKLVAIDKSGRAKVVLLDPNAALRRLDLGNVSEFKWKDRQDRNWSGVLVKPPQYDPGRRYPLVIQAHGYPEDQTKFVASGSFTSAFAARPLAAAGILVLQINSDYASCPVFSPQEVECELAGYESAIEELATSGVIDRKKIGMIGFSRTSLYTLTALTQRRFDFVAATIHDGYVLGYFQYLMGIDVLDNANAGWINAMIGPPFGEGLRKWLELSPAFNLDRIETPIRVEATGRDSLLFMWELYAGLRALHRPVDLLVLQEGTHPLTNPAQRMASQGGNVDWFRFWLQGYEDPDAAKAQQYIRWRKLREMQQARPAS